MVRVSETLGNSLLRHEFRFFGHRLRVLRSARETGGVLEVDYSAPPRARVPEHVHHDQEERLEVVSGTLYLRVGGRELALGPGQSAVGPPGVPHEWRNPRADEEVRFVVRIHPGLPVETMLEMLLALMRDRKTIGLLPRNPLLLAVMAREVGSWAYPTGIPMPVRKALFAPVTLLALVGSLLGYGVRYPEYSGLEESPQREDRPPATVSEAMKGQSDGGSATSHGLSARSMVCVLWLLNSAIGARVAIRENLPGEFAGMTRWHDPSADFFRGGGTALSPGLPLMAAQAVFTVLSARGGRAGKVGAAGLVALGAGSTLGVLGEPITYRVLSLRAFDAAKAPIVSVSAAIVLSALMIFFGTSRLRALRSGDA